MERLRVTARAKQKARQALRFNRDNPSRAVGLTKKEARKEGIASGIERAKQIIRSQTLSQDDTRRVAAFYTRFKSCRTRRCEEAINLWGGRRFGKAAVESVKNK